MAPNNNSNKSSGNSKSLPNDSSSPLKKSGHKVLVGNKLPFSPRTKVPTVNKVFVVGLQLGLILIQTHRQSSPTEDAFTQDAIKIIEDESTGVATRLNIIKICSRRQSQLIDHAIMQNSSYPSRWFVSIVPEERNTAAYRRQHVDQFIRFLNGIEWKYPQQFLFEADETRMLDDNISGTLDMHLLNCDIVVILKVFLFESFEVFLEDEDAIKAVLGPEGNQEQARVIFQELWRDL